MAAVTLLLCIASTASAGFFDFLGSDSEEKEYTMEYVTDSPCPEAFLPAGKITASTVMSSDGTVNENIYMTPNGAVGQYHLEALRDYCQKNRMRLLLSYLDGMDGADLNAAFSNGDEIFAVANVSRGEVSSGKGNFDDAIVFVDDAFFGMKNGTPYIGITDPYALQIEERRGTMLTRFDIYAAYYGIEDYSLEGLDEQIKELAGLEDQAAVAPDYSSVQVTYEGSEDTIVETTVIGRDQLDHQIYQAYLYEVEVVHRTSD